MLTYFWKYVDFIKWYVVVDICHHIIEIINFKLFVLRKHIAQIFAHIFD